jgi:hypothetical protein
MPDEPVTTRFLVEHDIDRSTLIERCIETGLRGNSAGATHSWEVGTDNGRKCELSQESAIREVETGEWAWIRMWINQFPIKIGFSHGGRTVPNINNVSVSTSELYLARDADNVEQNLDSYINVARLLYDLTSPIYGYGLYNEKNNSKYKVKIDQLEAGIPPFPYWLNFYSPKLTESIGRERLGNVPGERVEELDDNGFMILTNKFPYEFGPLNDQANRVASYLGLSFP